MPSATLPTVTPVSIMTEELGTLVSSFAGAWS